MQTNQQVQQFVPPLWARIVGAVTFIALDNIFMIAAFVAMHFGFPITAICIFVVAIYKRLTDIRDSIENISVTVTVQAPTNKEGEQA